MTTKKHLFTDPIRLTKDEATWWEGKLKACELFFLSAPEMLESSATDEEKEKFESEMAAYNASSQFVVDTLSPLVVRKLRLCKDSAGFGYAFASIPDSDDVELSINLHDNHINNDAIVAALMSDFFASHRPDELRSIVVYIENMQDDSEARSFDIRAWFISSTSCTNTCAMGFINEWLASKFRRYSR